MKTYTRVDLARLAAARMGVPQYEAKPWVDAVIAGVMDALTSGETEKRIELRGLGSFRVSIIPERPNAFNPRTLKSYRLPPRRKLVFKPGRKLQAQLRQPVDEAAP